MSTRLFVAIDLPDEVNRQLSEYAEVLRDVRWYEPSKYHLTLKFIGETDRQQFERISRQLSEIHRPPFKLTIDRLGYFPPNRHPRVIWAGFEENESLLALQEEIEERLTTVGIEREERAYTPHVTLGKNKGVPKTRVETYLERRQDIYIPEIPVNSFILYSSDLQPEGAVHTPQETFELENTNT